MVGLIGFKVFKPKGVVSGGFLKGQTDPGIVLRVGLLLFRENLGFYFPWGVTGVS